MDYFRAKRYLNTLQDWERDGNGGGIAGGLSAPDACPLAPDGKPAEGLCVGHCGRYERQGYGGERPGRPAQGMRPADRYLLRHRTCTPSANASGSTAGFWTRTTGRSGSQIFTIERADSKRRDTVPTTRFEAFTALAASTFAQAGVEIGVFEVGLGGRFDATNAWDAGVSVPHVDRSRSYRSIGRYSRGDRAGQARNRPCREAALYPCHTET